MKKQNTKFKIWDKVVVSLDWRDKPYRIWIVEWITFYSDWIMVFLCGWFYYDFNTRLATSKEIKKYFNL